MTHRLRATEFSDSCITPEPTSRRQGAGNCLLFVALQEVEGLAGFPRAWVTGTEEVQTDRQEWVWCGQVNIPLKNKHQALEASYLEIPSTGM